MDRGSNPSGGETFRTRPERPWGLHSLLYNAYRLSSPGVKRMGRGVNHPLIPSAKVKEKVELHLYSPSGPSWPALGRMFFTFAFSDSHRRRTWTCWFTNDTTHAYRNELSVPHFRHTVDVYSQAKCIQRWQLRFVFGRWPFRFSAATRINPTFLFCGFPHSLHADAVIGP